MWLEYIRRLGGECKYASKCGKFDSTSVTCNKNGGTYYNPGSKAGCYRDMEEKEK